MNLADLEKADVVTWEHFVESGCLAGAHSKCLASRRGRYWLGRKSDGGARWRAGSGLGSRLAEYAGLRLCHALPRGQDRLAGHMRCPQPPWHARCGISDENPILVRIKRSFD